MLLPLALLIKYASLKCILRYLRGIMYCSPCNNIYGTSHFKRFPSSNIFSSIRWSCETGSFAYLSKVSSNFQFNVIFCDQTICGISLTVRKCKNVFQINCNRNSTPIQCLFFIRQFCFAACISIVKSS